MRSYLVTGADGYIGQGVVEKLLNRGNKVYAMGFNELKLKHDNLVQITGDIFSNSLDWIASEPPDVMVHLAWRDGFDHYASSHIEDLPKHYSFIGKVLKLGVRQIAIMGSMHEVGYFEGAIDEGTPCNPTTPYGVAKNALRQLSRGLSQNYGAVFQWLRGFYLVDNSGKGESIFAKIVAAEKGGNTRFPFTSGKNAYDFIPYDVFCEQVVAAVSQDSVEGIINICSGTPIALGEYIEDFIHDNNFSIQLAYGEYPDRPYDSPAIWGNNNKISMIQNNKLEDELDAR